jgi:glycerophosphodiester phosphodiesterase
MKFGEQLEMHKIPEWSSEYFNFKGVKKRLKTILKAYKSSGKSPIPDPEVDTLFVAAFPKGSVLDSHNHDDPLLKPDELVAMLFAFFNTELDKINEFYLTKKA